MTHMIQPHRETLNTKKCLASLSPLQAHELDMVQAARLGIDISHLMPGERCKYPSRFCCHKRARKSTGKLHRFCEAHRARAKVNQNRWTALRRRQEQDKDGISASLAVCAETATWLVRTNRMLAAYRQAQPPPQLRKLAPLQIAVAPNKVDLLAMEFPDLPTAVDTLSEEDISLSEDDIDMLTTIVAECERSTAIMTIEDACLMAMLQDMDVPMQERGVVESSEIHGL